MNVQRTLAVGNLTSKCMGFFFGAANKIIANAALRRKLLLTHHALLIQFQVQLPIHIHVLVVFATDHAAHHYIVARFGWAVS